MLGAARATFALITVTLVMLSSSAYAGTCWVDNLGFGYTSPIETGTQLPTNVCGHKVYGSGTGGCTLQIKHNAAGSAGTDCLELGYKVTVEGGGYSVSCSGNSDCGKAIKITGYAGGSGNVDISNLSIGGRWTTGIDSDITNATATDVDMYCSTLASGMIGFDSVKTVDHARVNACATGVKLAASQTLVDSIVYDNTTAVAGTSGGFGTFTVDNVQILSNSTALSTVYPGVNPALKQSSLQYNDCNCRQDGSCVDPSACYSLTGSVPSFIDEFIYD